MDVHFEPQRGSTFSIEVGFFDTVLEIKEKVQKYQGIPISKQTLIFNGHVLQDDDNVEHCEILQDSNIQLIVAPESGKAIVEIENSSPSNKIQLLVKMPMSKIHVPLEMDVNDTIGRLKEKIQEMEAVPTNLLVIRSSGIELQDQRSLHDCELFDNSGIDVGFRVSPTSLAGAQPVTTMIASKKLNLLILLPSCENKKIPIEVNALERVGELRKELHNLQQMQILHLPEDYFFIHKQDVMDDDKTFRWHHVAQGDTIEIFPGRVTNM